MSIVLAVAEGEVFVNDAEIQKSALQVIINCVCAPDKRMSSIGKFIAGSPRRRLPQQTKANESVLTKMWNVVQSNNGIKVELTDGLKDTALLHSQLIFCSPNWNTSGAAVSADGEDAHYRCGSDPSSGV